MAISAATASFRGIAVPSAHVIASASDHALSAYIGTAQVTLDGTSTSFVVNFVDGTTPLSMTPRGVIATANTVSGTVYVGVSISNITATSFTVVLAAAGTNGTVVKVSFQVL